MPYKKLPDGLDDLLKGVKYPNTIKYDPDNLTAITDLAKEQRQDLIEQMRRQLQYLNTPPPNAIYPNAAGITPQHEVKKVSKPTADFRVTPSGLVTLLQKLIKIQRPVMISGPPGIGKTEIGNLVAKIMKMLYLDIRAPLLEPVDLRGIPRITAEDLTRWAPPEFFPKKNCPDTLICFDELPNAPRMTQNALYQLTLDRRVGEYILPNNVAIIACGNREEDNSGAMRMSTALASRFIHIDLKVSVEEWYDWALDNGIRTEVIFFIQFMNDMLHNFDPDGEEYAYPCPRTWKFVSDEMNEADDLDSTLRLAMFRGTVGEEAGIHFNNFLKIWKSVPHPNTIISNPTSAVIPREPDVLIAVAGALYRIAEDSNFEAIITYANRMSENKRKDVAQFLIDSCVKQNKQLQNNRHYLRWITKKS